MNSQSAAARSNNSFKPNLLRYTNNMAGRACHVVGYATQVGLTQALDVMTDLSELAPEIELLNEELFREDDLGCVIRTHLRIESLVIQFVEKSVQKPVHLKKLNLDYDGYVSLATALGLKNQYASAFRAIGTLRNSFAHRLDTRLTRQTVRNLYNSFSSEEKNHIQEMFRRIKDENEETRHVARYSDLDPRDQFKLIAITLWGIARIAVLRLQNS